MRRVAVVLVAVSLGMAFNVVCSVAQQEQSLIPSHSVRAVEPGLSGVWVGTYSSQQVPSTQVTLVFQQSESTITGTYLTANGAQGTMAGTINKAGQIVLGARQTTPTCIGEFSMPIKIDNEEITWTFRGWDCLGSEDGSGSAGRAP